VNAPRPVAAIAVRAADLADPGESARIDAFVADQPDATVFHRPQWSRAVARGCGQRAHYLVAERGGALVGCLPLTEIRSRLFGNALVSAGFGTGGGILGEAAEPLAASAWDLALRLGCAGAELRGGPIPAGWEETAGTYSNFDRSLPATEAELLASIPRRQRAEVRRALGSPLETSAGTDARHRDAHFRVYAESVRNLGTPVFPRSLYAAALDEFGADADIVVVWKDGRPLAALLNFYFRGICHPSWGGGTLEARAWRANDLVYFDVMRRAIARGCTGADFGRSKIGTGPHARKKIWDFEETPLVYAVRTADGERPRAVNPLDPRYRLKIAAWQKLPLWAANRIGPVIARGLG
jgi:FemAB-related protein (PEP-CTERM system-associated)